MEIFGRYLFNKLYFYDDVLIQFTKSELRRKNLFRLCFPLVCDDADTLLVIITS